MKSPMLKRRLNPFLLATTILVLSILASLSVLYQGQLSSILQEKNNLSETLEQRQERIENLELENENLTEEVSEKEDRIADYENEIDLLDSQIDNLNSTVQSLRSSLEQLETENADLREQVGDLNDTMFVICDSNETYIENGEDQCNRYGHEYRGS